MRIRFACFLLLITACCGLQACTPAVKHSATSETAMRSYEYDGNFAAVVARLQANPDGLNDTEKLHSLMTAYWEESKRLSPSWATSLGDHRYDDQWRDFSPKGRAARRAFHTAAQTALATISPDGLNADNRTHADLLRWEIDNAVAADGFHSEHLAVSNMGGPHTGMAGTLSQMPANTRKDYENILLRLQGYPYALDQLQALLAEGIDAGIVPPRETVDGVPEQINRLITPDPFESPMLAAFKRRPEGLDEAVFHRMMDDAKYTFLMKINPALKQFRAFIESTYLPACRESIAWTDLPHGQEWYAHQVRYHTTTDLTPDEIHAIGLSEVQRIKAEMEKVMQRTAFKGDLQAFFEFLRTDKRFFCADAETLLARYRGIAKRVDPKLMNLFGRLPRTTYGVEPVPTYLERNTTTAYYEPGSPDGGRPGTFFANTYDLASRPTWEMIPLTLHEAVPGHHLQIAIAQELDEMPEFRKNAWFTAYGEGWALYAESLGDEMGMYDDPYDKFGQLTYEMWRAIRLVVDTGMHAKGWSRDMAIEFFKQNSSKTQHDIEVEVDRYIGWAGQALAYKIGELKIKELRALARKELGDSFDLRAFHDAVLAQGTLPLSLLEANIKAWIDETKNKQ